MTAELILKELNRMRSGFIYDKDKCVNCKACSAACILENGWNVSGREIITYNPEALPLIHVINLSLACNHCESAVCMTGCPSSAYTRDEKTGAIILDESKCVGCRYCQWNCPYDAPKFNAAAGTIVKCNLCYNEINNGFQPACASACPTGALRFGALSDSFRGSTLTWFPEKNLNPSIEFTDSMEFDPVVIIPQADNLQTASAKVTINIKPEMSLIVFSFLSTVLVSVMSSSFISGIVPNTAIFTSFLILTGLVSLFHLGRKQRFWRAVANLKTSPLSREIAAFIVFSALSVLALTLHLPSLFIASTLTGLVFLVLIDSVYIFTGKNKSVLFHSGQTFLSALIIISFFSHTVLPFVFVALIKLFLAFPAFRKQQEVIVFRIRFLRIAFLILTGLSLVVQTPVHDYFVIFLFLTGELFDRILFYIDFNPMNIRNLIREQLNTGKDEKKRG